MAATGTSPNLRPVTDFLRNNTLAYQRNNNSYNYQEAGPPQPLFDYRSREISPDFSDPRTHPAVTRHASPPPLSTRAQYVQPQPLSANRHYSQSFRVSPIAN